MHSTKTVKTLGILCVLASLGILGACQPQPISQQRFLQFGTVIDITLTSSSEITAIRLFDEIEHLLKKRHSEWHSWQQGILTKFNSDLSKAPSTGTPIPPALTTLIYSSKEYYLLTQGLFNPALGKLIAAWGFHESATPDYALIRQIQKDIPGMHDLEIKNGRGYSHNPYLQLDFGAIAKGLAIKQIAQLLNKNQIRHFIINAGGDIYAQGHKKGKDWRVAIENPFNPGIIGTLSLDEPLSIFTSGNYRRFYTDEDQPKRHHIINPDTGKPSINISAATVLHKDPVIADIAATTLMLTDILQLKNMALTLGIEHFLVITEQQDVFASRTMLKKINWLKPQNFNIHTL